MRHPSRNAAVLVALMVAACEPQADPVGAPPATLTAAAEPMAVGAGTFFALDVLEVPSPDADGAYVINDAGQVAGGMTAPDGTRDRDFFFDPGTGEFREIPKNSTAPYLYGVYMNESGTVAGTTECATAECVRRPYRWTASGGVEELVGGYARSVANAINDAGIVAGSSGPEFGAWRAARWLPDGTFEEVDLGTIVPAGAYSRALDVNNAGHMVMDAAVDDVGIPMLWTPAGGTVRLTALEAAVAAIAPGDVEDISPWEINEAGDILGSWSSTGADRRNLFVWTAGGTLIDFNSMSDFGDVIASGMNDLGEVVFTIVDGSWPDLTYTPWFWSAEAGVIALPTLDPDRTLAADVNNHGVIAGRSGETPVLWRPLTSAGDALDGLEDTLDDVLAGGAVDVEGGNGLRAKLLQIRDHLAAGRANAARNQLTAFVNQVEAMIADGRLSADDGAALLADAATLSGLLS